MEEEILNHFKQVAAQLANRWESRLTAGEILSEAWMLYSMKPQTWLKAYQEEPDTFKGYVYTAISNHLKTNKLPSEAKWYRHNYLCDDGMLDAVSTGQAKIEAIYQPTPTELRRDVLQLLAGTAPAFLQHAWKSITPTQRERLIEFANSDHSLTDAERKASYKFIMRVS